MKRIIAFLLTAITIVLSIFALTSCKKQNVRLQGYQFGKTEIIDAEVGTVIRFHPNEKFEYDVADFEKVKFTFKARGVNTTNQVEYKGFAYPPENARGNPELQYFEMTISSNIALDQTLFFKARGTLYEEPAGEERAKHGAPSIFWTFVIGIAMALVFTGFASVGLQIWDDTPGKIIVISANLLPIAGNIAAYSLWGVGRGIILSVFCAAIVGLTVFLGWNRD